MKTQKHLKWIGSKAETAEAIVAQMPPGDRWVEPFCGAAHGWLAAKGKYKKGLLSDINQDLIDMYIWLQKDCERFIGASAAWFTGDHNNADSYYMLRNKFDAEQRGLDRSTLFLYLAWHSYNGLVRYNQSKGFNVPFGLYKTNPTLPSEGLRAMADSLFSAEVVCQDWRRLLSSFLRTGDVIYNDPPYWPLSRTANFTTYYGQKFVQADHEGLARAAERLRIRKTPMAISNADIEQTRKLYENATWTSRFLVGRSCGPTKASRGKASELLALYC